MAVVLERVGREIPRRQPQSVELVGREDALERDVVDRHDARHAGSGVLQVRRCKPRLPVVGVHEIGPPAIAQTLDRDARGRPAERREAHVVVGVVVAVDDVRPARPVEEVRRVEQQHAAAVDRRGAHHGGTAEQIRISPQPPRASHLLEHRRVRGHQHARGPAERIQRARQRAHDVGEPARLDERRALRGDRQHPATS